MSIKGLHIGPPFQSVRLLEKYESSMYVPLKLINRQGAPIRGPLLTHVPPGQTYIPPDFVPEPRPHFWPDFWPDIKPNLWQGLRLMARRRTRLVKTERELNPEPTSAPRTSMRTRPAKPYSGRACVHQTRARAQSRAHWRPTSIDPNPSSQPI